MANGTEDVCGWPVDTACLPDVDGDEDRAALLDTSIELAADVLWALSGRQFGACRTVYRPCPSPCATVARRGVCGCAGGCTRVGPSIVRLPGPVHEVEEIRVAGAVLDPAEYTVEGDLMIRTGGAAWPSQDLTRPAGEPGTWEVEYRRGVPVPEHVGRLVGALAAEFYAACTGGKCRLPRRVQSVNRQGVSYQMVDPSDVYASGRTGLSEVDLWLAAVNPNRVGSRPRVR